MIKKKKTLLNKILLKSIELSIKAKNKKSSGKLVLMLLELVPSNAEVTLSPIASDILFIINCFQCILLARSNLPVIFAPKILISKRRKHTISSIMSI